MSQRKIDKSENTQLGLQLDAIDKNFNDVFDALMIIQAAFTLASQTAAQKMFNSSPGGAVNLGLGQYEFECLATLSVLSATSGSFGFALGGTATIGSQLWESHASKSALNSGNATDQYSVNTAANTALAAASTATTGYMKVRGTFTVTVAGTIIPELSQATASAAVVGVGSFFRIKKISTSAVAAVVQPPAPGVGPCQII